MERFSAKPNAAPMPASPRVALCSTDKAETRLIENTARELGYTASRVLRPDTVIAHLLRTKAQILVLNTPFGNTDKYTILKAIRTHPRLRDTCVILLVPATDATDDDIKHAWRYGVDAYEKKPIVKEDMEFHILLTSKNIRSGSIKDQTLNG